MSADFEPQASQIFMAGERATPFRGVVGPLVRIFGHDVYDNWLLTPRAQKELRSVALLMTVIFAFDFGTWTLLFNSLFHASGNIFQISWATAGAVIGAFLVALAVIIFERGFFCHDTSGHPFRTILALVMRIAVIAAAALITAQPVELMAFRGPIRTRRHEEQLRQEIVEKETLIGEAETEGKVIASKIVQLPQDIENLPINDQRKAAKLRLARADDTLRDATSAAQQAQNDQRAAKHAIESSNRELEKQQADLRSRIASGTDASDPKLKAAQQRVEDLKDAVRRAQTSTDTADQRAAAAASAIISAHQEVAAASEAARQAGLDVTQALNQMTQHFEEQKDLSTRRRDDLRKYIGAVRKHGMEDDGVRWPAFDKNSPPYFYKLNLGNVYEQLQVINDLRAERAAQWPAVSDKEKKDFVKTYGLEDDDSAAAKARRADLAHIVKQGYWAALAIALVIPTLVLATKLLLIEDLKAYYSTARQAAAGNPHAIAVMPQPGQSWISRLGASLREFWILLRSRSSQVQP